MTLEEMYPPLPPPPKKELWKRYAAGEKLQPTYGSIKRPIPPYLTPQMPGDRREKSGADSFEALLIFGILIFAAIVIGCVYTFTK